MLLGTLAPIACFLKEKEISKIFHKLRNLNCKLLKLGHRIPLHFYFISIGGVYVLECDVGQTEFTPPGCISLHYITLPVLGKNCFLSLFQWAQSRKCIAVLGNS